MAKKYLQTNGKISVLASKKELGQFFTSNSDYILQGFEEFVKDKIVIDPFAGNGDLLNWADKNGCKSSYGLDIDEKLLNGKIKLNNSLVSIPQEQFNITNPPYLATNKMSVGQKSSLKMEGYEDLYLLAIKQIIRSNPEAGIVIIPVNFFSAENSNNLRKEFMTYFDIKKVNYFREQVFDDTTYNIVAIYYIRKIQQSSKQNIEITFYPDNKKKTFELEECFDYRIAGQVLSEIINTKTVKTIRLTETYMKKNAGKQKIQALFNDKKTNREYLISLEYKSIIDSNIILLNCIDTNSSEDSWINAEDIRNIGYSCLVGKNTSRNIAYIILPDISLANQEKIIPMFNTKLNE